jgi:hypothetical protein
VLGGGVNGSPCRALSEEISGRYAKFGGRAKEREPQRPSAAFLERERSFDEQRKRTEALKQARLTGHSSDRDPARLIFEVVHRRGQWRILHRNKHSAQYADQGAAILAAKDLARKKRQGGQSVEVRLIRIEGQVVTLSIDEATVTSTSAPLQDP